MTTNTILARQLDRLDAVLARLRVLTETADDVDELVEARLLLAVDAAVLRLSKLAREAAPGLFANRNGEGDGEGKARKVKR
jgi:hypothetical protein